MDSKATIMAALLLALAAVPSQPVTAASGIDFSLAAGGQIKGTVTDATTGAGLANFLVYALDPSSSEIAASSRTDGSGDYSLTVDTGSYLVYAPGRPLTRQSAYAGEFYPDAYTPAMATPVSAVRAQTVENIDLALGPGGSITGRVRGDYGGTRGLAPIPFSQVRAIRDDSTLDGVLLNSLALGTTDLAGNYRIDGLAPGNYQVVARGRDDFAGEYFTDAYSADVATTVAVSNGRTTSGVHFDLAVGAQIAGTVTSAVTDQNLGGVRVRLVNPDAEDSFDSFATWLTTTAADGGYRFSGLWPGTYYVLVSFDGSDHAEYAAELYPGVYREGQATAQVVALGQVVNGVDFDAEVGGVIEGRTRRADNGLPLEQIEVQGVPTDDALLWWYVYTSALAGNESGDDGRYRIEGLPPGDYKLVALPDRFYFPPLSTSPETNQYFAGQYYSGAYTAATADDLGVVLGRTLAGIDFNMEIGGVISGTVTDEANGRPLPDIIISSQPNLPGRTIEGPDAETIDSLDYLIGFRTATSKDDGTYEIIGLPPRETIAGASDNEPVIYLPEFYKETMDFLTATPILVTAPGVETASINGIVESEDGTPLSGLAVRVLDSDSGALVGETTTAADGRFVIDSLFPGDYRIQIIGTDDYAGEFFGDTTSEGSAQLVSVDFGRNALDINIVLSSTAASGAVAVINVLIKTLLDE